MGIPANNKFAGGGAKPGAAAGAKPKTQVKASRFGTFKPREEGPPMLECGPEKTKVVYRVRFDAAEEVVSPKPDGNDSIKLYVIVVSKDDEAPTAIGTRALMLYMQSTYGRADFNEAIVAFSGYDADEEADLNAYLEFDPDGHFFAAAVGDANGYAKEAEALAGRVADVQVGYKKDDGKGGYFRTYKWAPVPDDAEEQDTSPKIERLS